MNKIILFCLLLGSFQVEAQQRQKRLPVTLTLSIQQENRDKDLILFHPDQLLRISDFRGRPDPSAPGVAATTHSGIQVALKGIEKEGRFEVTVDLLVYFDKERSWFRKAGRNAIVLAHEQIHFDITALAACDLMRALQQETYTSADVKEKVRKLQTTYMQRLQERQRLYDKETRHGTLADQQEAWARQIEKEKKSLLCYP